MANFKEKRKHDREAISVVFSLLDGKSPETGEQGRGFVINLSEGGAAFESDAFLETGQQVYFELPVPIRIWAKVLRVSKEGVRTRYAVEFEKVRLADKAMLKKLLEQAKKSGGGL